MKESTKKAIELVNKFTYCQRGFINPVAKQCALICVDEILGKRLAPHLGWKEVEFWQEAKEEINNIK
jgi:hypothetical protein